MASFAKLNSNNIVERIESVVNEVLKDSNGVEQEAIGIQFLRKGIHSPKRHHQDSTVSRSRRRDQITARQ